MSNLAIEWLGDRVKIIDQTRLPQEEVYLELSHYQDIASAITKLKIRGAPAIGVAGAYAIALGALEVAVAEALPTLGARLELDPALVERKPVELEGMVRGLHLEDEVPRTAPDDP